MKTIRTDLVQTQLYGNYLDISEEIGIDDSIECIDIQVLRDIGELD